MIDDLVVALQRADEILERVCVDTHTNYEAAAVEHGWETQKRSRVWWPDVPEENKRTMRGALKPLTDAWISDMMYVVINHPHNCLECFRYDMCGTLRTIDGRLRSWGVIDKSEE